MNYNSIFRSARNLWLSNTKFPGQASLSAIAIAALLSLATGSPAFADPKADIDKAKEAVKTANEQQKTTAEEAKKIPQDDEVLDDESATGGDEEDLDMPDEGDVPDDAPAPGATTKSM